MMLRKPLFLGALCLAAGAAAQPTLTQSTNGWVPVAGGVGITSFNTNNPALFYSPGPAGADLAYSFYTLDDNGGYDRFLDATSITPTSATFPTATVLSTNGGTDTMAYKVDASGIELVGLRTSLEGTVAYSNGIVELPFPCTFGTTWSDPFSLSYTAGGFPITRTGTINGIADGYGEIALPNMVLPEVLRVKVRKVQNDQTPLGVVYRSYTTYYYYDVNTRYPVMKISQDTVIASGGSPATTYVAEWQFGPGTGIVDLAGAEVVFNPYPNPTQGRVDLGMGQDELRAVEVFTTTGELVSAEMRTVSGSLTSVLDLTALSAGLYHVKVTAKDGRVGVRRVVVE